MKSRVHICVSPLFNNKLKEIQANNLLKGMRKSIRQITEELMKSGLFDDVEIKKDEIRIRMDKRRGFY